MADTGDGLPKATLLYAGSGTANTGYLADQVARLLAKQGAGDMTCLVSMGANLVQRRLDWNERSSGTKIVRIICGVLVILAGIAMVVT